MPGVSGFVRYGIGIRKAHCGYAGEAACRSGKHESCFGMAVGAAVSVVRYDPGSTKAIFEKPACRNLAAVRRCNESTKAIFERLPVFGSARFIRPGRPDNGTGNLRRTHRFLLLKYFRYLLLSVRNAGIYKMILLIFLLISNQYVNDRSGSDKVVLLRGAVHLW